MTKRTRDVDFRTPPLTFETRANGTVYVRPEGDLPAYPDRLTERLDHWAAATPDAIFLAQRDGDDRWQTVTYGEARTTVRTMGEALLKRDVGPDRPIAILSGNSIAHGLLGLAAQYVGVPYAPISPAYSLLSQDHAKLRHIVDLLTPGMVFAESSSLFANALTALGGRVSDVVTVDGGNGTTPLDALQNTPPSTAVDRASQTVDPDTVAKVLFTSGSTGMPKGVINTQRMLCCNQVMIRENMAFIQDAPPVIVDWLPWSHTFGSNHNFGLVLYNGGSLYIDDGKPTPDGIEKTVRNLRDIAPTVYFNVPKGYEALLDYLRAEPALRETFFSRVKLLFFAGAGLAPHIFDALEKVAEETCGETIQVMSGFGSTETAPLAMNNTTRDSFAGVIGVPVPGVELKLAPVGDKMEGRLRGPNITPGYWRQPDMTAQAFDEEGFYRFGDAMAPIDPDEPARGYLFDGRITEDFKLSSGTWVSSGPLRAKFIGQCAPYVADVVIAGENKDFISALIIPVPAACRALDPALPTSPTLGDVAASAKVRTAFTKMISELAEKEPGSSRRVQRAVLLDTPPSLDTNEMTDKGSINQSAVIKNRSSLVTDLYASTPNTHILCAG